MMKRKIVFGAAVAVMAVASIASAIGVTVIPTLGGATTSTGQAITSDGRYVVGTSGGTAGYVYDTTTGNTVGITTPFPRNSTVASGVGYRTTGGVNQLVIHGVYSTSLTGVWAFDLSTQPTSGNWSTSSFWGMTGEASALGGGNYNTLASGGLGTDLVYTASKQAGSGATKLKTVIYGKLIGATNTMTNILGTATIGGTTSPSATGVVAYSQSNQAWTGVYGSTSGVMQGTGPNGPYAIAANGSRAFGFKGGATPFAVDLSGGTFGTEYAMPVLPGSSSTSTAYGSSVNGQYAVGKCYVTDTDWATLWDLTDTGNITALNLNQWATDNNAMGGFTQLNRATSIGTNGAGELVITGLGLYGGASRAFVLTIPEPATLIFMVLGCLCLRRRR